MSFHGLVGRVVALSSLALALVGSPVSARAAKLTPESPEVEKAIQRAIAFLASDQGKTDQLGGKALVGLVFLKSGADPAHPRVVEAAEAIQSAVRNRGVKDLQLSVYNAGLAIIFLVTLDPSKYTPEIETLLAYLQAIQKPHGGWGYPTGEHQLTGDTSMTQYAVLSSWEAAQAGFRVPREMIESVTEWLLKTQDPSGGFGYQGIVAEGSSSVKQQGVRHSMVAAGLGSLYVCANLLGFSEKIQQDNDLPKAVRETKSRAEARPAINSKIEPRRLHSAQSAGNLWMRSNYKIDPEQWTYYYLYALERYWSFREAAEGERELSWYHDGARFLLRNQTSEGSWDSKKEGLLAVDTAFGALFLLRSAKKSIEHAHYFRSSVMVSGRGLPQGVSQVKLSGGRVVPRPTAQQAAAMLDSVADSYRPDHANAVDVLGALPAEEAKPLLDKEGARIRELVLGGNSAGVRRAAVRVLVNARDLRHVPILIGALRDADFSVVREANQGLQQFGRKLRGFDLTERSSPSTRQEIIDKWKAWYRAICPDAEFPN